MERAAEPCTGRLDKRARYRSLAVAAAFAGLLVTSIAARAQSVRIESTPDAAEKLQEALITAEPGTVIELGKGTFEIADGLSLDVDSVTIRGQGADASVLSFSGQQGAGEGLLITSSKVVLEDFAVEDTKGDGIKAKGSDQITFRRLRVEWTGGPKSTNGAYGIYPVESKNVLIEDSTVIGASDAGIYVGQSEQIVIRNNRAEKNVAGIEVENSYFADVHDNVAMHNTGGILIFDLPNLKQSGGHSIRVFNNKITDNDTPNFAPEGNIVATVPMGTGVLVMANRNVHVFGNTFDNNGMVHVAIVSYFEDYDDENYYPHPRAVYVRDNTYGRGGFAPDGEVGKVFAKVSGVPVPDIVWDGVTPLGEWVTWTGADDRIFIKEADEVSFANLRMISNTLIPWGVTPDRDKANFAGEIAEPAPIRLPQDGATPQG